MESNDKDTELSKGQQKLLSVLKKFESGDIDSSYIENALGGVGKFIDLLEKQNLIDYLNPLDSAWDDHQNYLLYKKVEQDPSYVWEVVNSLSDIVKIGDIYYFDTTGEELAGFFNTGRGDISQSSIAELIEGSYDFGAWDVTDDEYRDVYDNLNPEKKNLVDNTIREELKNWAQLDLKQMSLSPFQMNKVETMLN